MKTEFYLYTIDEGNNRVYYRTKNIFNEILYYCLYDDRNIKLYRCSKDLEPEYEVQLEPELRFKFERPNPNSNLTRAACKWIHNMVGELK